MVDFGPYGRRSSIRNDRTAEPVMLERSEASNTRTCHPERVKRRGISIKTKEEILRFAQNDRTTEPVMLERNEASNTRTCHPERVKRRWISIKTKEEIPHTRFGMTEPQGAASLVNVYCLMLLVTSAVRAAVVTRSTGEFSFYTLRTHRRTIPCLVDIWRSSGCLQSR